MVITEVLATALADSFSELDIQIAASEIQMERPSLREHGDWSSNVALMTSKSLGRNPRELAEDLVKLVELKSLDSIERMEVAGPGFINFHLAPQWLHDVLTDVLTQGEDGYARPTVGNGASINLEFVSANPTGPLHAGGGRWGAYGDSLARIFRRCGYETFTEYYINDRGLQTELFGASLAARRDGTELPEDGYAGEYVAEWASEMPYEADPVAWGQERALTDVRESLTSMNVGFDHWASETALVESGAMEEAVGILRSAGWVDEHDGATWLRTSDFGDEKDRVLVKSDGEPTYFVPDIAYHHQKFQRGELVIDVLGADHHGYVPRMAAAMEMLGHPPDCYEAIIGQNVTLVRGGEEIKLSKRTGTMVEVRELIEAVGPDVARFAYLLQSIDTRQTIDIDVLSSQANENPVYYVQYAYARIAAVGREATHRGVSRDPFDEIDVTVLTHERELEILRCLSTLPEIVEIAARDRAPHRVANWIRELAATFHGFYHDCPVLRSDTDEAVQQARLWLVESARVGFAIGLDLLGIAAPEEM
ncbi:MAG: arginine--tRNA ligase [Acidimicrobiaceae bacterium]|nr:arginine--tRNA ligase [Acidimicrobiaceae bacterium]